MRGYIDVFDLRGSRYSCILDPWYQQQTERIVTWTYSLHNVLISAIVVLLNDDSSIWAVHRDWHSGSTTSESLLCFCNLNAVKSRKRSVTKNSIYIGPVVRKWLGIQIVRVHYFKQKTPLLPFQAAQHQLEGAFSQPTTIANPRLRMVPIRDPSWPCFTLFPGQS